MVTMLSTKTYPSVLGRDQLHNLATTFGTLLRKTSRIEPQDTPALFKGQTWQSRTVSRQSLAKVQ
eukprot:2285878-Amphidinium_carterae.1